MTARDRSVAGLCLFLLLAACARGEEGQQQQRALEIPGAQMMFPTTSASNPAKTHVAQGLHEMDMGRAEAANQHFKQAVEADPAFAYAYLQLAISSPSLDEYKTHLDKAVQNAERASEAERLLIQIEQRGLNNDVEGQRELAQRLVEVEPRNPRAWLTLASIESARRRVAEARSAAARAIEVAPNFVPAYIQLGNSYLLTEPTDPARAEEHIRKAVELAPNEAMVHDYLGDVYRAQGRLEQARNAYTRGTELDPTMGLLFQQRGHVHSFLGNYDQSRADYDAAIRLGKANEKASFAIWRALVNVHAGDPDAAIAELERLVQSIDGMGIPDPDGLKSFALAEQSTIALHHRRFDVAERAIQQWSALQRKSAERVGTDEFRRMQEANIAYIEGVLAARKGDYPRATSKAQEAMRLVAPNRDPRKDEWAHDLMGLVALLQGRHAEAVSHYEQANPNNIYTTHHHALALEDAGRTEEAKRLFNKVATHNFNNAGLALVRKEAQQKASPRS
jgi:tetratricopeptide (TPR) repeat protein